MSINPGGIRTLSQRIGDRTADELEEEHDKRLPEIKVLLRQLKLKLNSMDAIGAFGPTGWDVNQMIEVVDEWHDGEWSKDYIADAAYHADHAA